MKTILTVWHSSNKGKTKTLREFANLLLINYPTYKPVFPIPAAVAKNGDFRLVIEINGKIIGVESQGDPNTNLRERLIGLADNFKCDVIICSSRTRGDTVAAIDNIAQTRGFYSIWTSTYQLEGRSQQIIANKLKAKHILDLLQASGVL